MSNGRIAATLFLVALGWNVRLIAAEPNAAQVEQFERKIRPLLASKCLQCHSAEERKGGLSLASGAGTRKGGDSGPVVVPGAADRSRLIEVVKQTGDVKMPPDERLADSEIADLVAWVQDGAIWPPQRVAIPLGNLFDDPAGTRLADAIVSDEFKATADPNDLGIDRVLQGWGAIATVASSVRFDFSPLGAGESQFDSVVNNAWGSQGGIRTKGERLPPDGDRAEEGIGMHANALITFDLAEIRSAGDLPALQEFTFRSDRSGLNDDVFGIDASSAHLVVLVVQQADASTGPAVAAYVNGRQQEVALDNGVWRLAGDIGPPLRANGKFATFNVPVPGDARYLVLATTGAGQPDQNPINSDHTVFSGARLEFVTEGEGLIASKAGSKTEGFSITDEQRAYWAFQPISRPVPPPVQDASWPRTSIDRFVLAELENRQLSPSPPADKRALIRRVTFDLTGLPPSPEDFSACAAEDFDAAYVQVVDRLLSSPHYGERWARHWLDVARYAEDQAHTFAARLYPNGFYYRDWVVRSLNEDLPYDQFVVQQIAGDLLPDAAASQQLSALGYFALGPVYYADAGCAAKAALDELDDRVDTLTAGFLGLTVACARCHDHKFDPISQQDYYALAGVFASSSYREAPLVPQAIVDQYNAGQASIRQAEEQLNKHMDAEGKRLSESFARQSARYLVATWLLAHPADSAKPATRADLAREMSLQEFVLERWQNWLVPGNRDKSPRFQAWFDLLAQQDFSPAEAGEAAPKEVLAAAESVQAALRESLDERDRLEREYQAAVSAAPEAEKGKIARPALDKSHADLLAVTLTNDGPLVVPRDRVEGMLDEAAKQQLTVVKMDVESAKKAAPQRYPFAHSLTEGQPADMKLHIRGSATQTGAEVPRRSLEILSPDKSGRFTAGSGRLELARAIASPDNPLTARVIVNRLWSHHFGRGIVATPSNFGQMGERPSHPQLLDYLAGQLIDQGWSLKAIHREILLSAAYRQSSTFDPIKFERDPENTWLWRMTRRRLDAESWRDALLSASGGLNDTVGGPPGNLADATFVRRTMYGAVSRHNLDSMLRLFDFPDPNISSARRTLTTVPLQQLFVLNSEFMIARAKELAERLAREFPTDDAARIRQSYLLLYGRPATDQELQVGIEFLQAPDDTEAAGGRSQLSRWEQYAQVLLAANEFAYID